MNKKLFFKITDDAKTLTSELLEQCKAKFPVWSYYENKRLDNDFPPPKKATTRYFKKVVEAEDEKGKSYNDLKNPENYCTLRERLIMELQYFNETGNHLDIENITLCSGSRYSDGYVPLADWNDGWFRVRWYHRDYRHPDLRSREAVTLDPSPLSPSETSGISERVAELEKFKMAVEKVLKI